LEKGPVTVKLKKMFRTFSLRHGSFDVLCPNFVKFVPREIGEIVRCLPDKNKFSWLPGYRYCASRPKSARASRQQYTQSAPDFIQISLRLTEL